MSNNLGRSQLDVWCIDAEYSTSNSFTDDEVLDLVDHFSDYGVVAQTGTNVGQLGLSWEVEAASHADAYAMFQDFTAKLSEHLNGAEVIEVSIMTEAQKEAELDKPFMPEVAGLTEVAELAGVTRQRANRIVKNKSFPEPITELASGKIWWKPAVQNWVKHWDKKTGRPAKDLAVA